MNDSKIEIENKESNAVQYGKNVETIKPFVSKEIKADNSSTPLSLNKVDKQPDYIDSQYISHTLDTIFDK